MVGLDDTRLGDDSSELTRMARSAQLGVARERSLASAADGANASGEGRAQENVKPAKVQWTSAGSHKDENGIWRGGVALGSYGTAVLHQLTVVNDCRGWGRYQGRVCLSLSAGAQGVDRELRCYVAWMQA